MTKSPVTVNSVKGITNSYTMTKKNVLESKNWISCSGDTVTVNTTAECIKGPSYSCTWEQAGLKIENGIVKKGIYNLEITPQKTNVGNMRMVVNVDEDISLEEFNMAINGGELGASSVACLLSAGLGYTVEGIGSFDGSEDVIFYTNLLSAFEDLDLEWGDSFEVIMHRDANGEIYAELPNGYWATGNDKQVSNSMAYSYSDGMSVYALYIPFSIDLSQYDLENVKSGFKFYIEDNDTTNQMLFTLFDSFTPASTSTAGSLSASKQWWIQSGDTEGNGFFIEFGKLNTYALGIRNLDVSTRDGAQEAISASQKALNIVSEMRSKIGAQQNRLEYAASNSRNMAENAQNAESRIRDTDMAEEMVANATANILVQAGQSVLAQNNHKADGVLELLR